MEHLQGSNRCEWVSPTVKQNTWLAHDGTIVVNIQLQHSWFCEFGVARTYLLQPSSVQEQQYRALVWAFQAPVSALIPGYSMSGPRIAAEQSLLVSGQVGENRHQLWFSCGDSVNCPDSDLVRTAVGNCFRKRNWNRIRNGNGRFRTLEPVQAIPKVQLPPQWSEGASLSIKTYRLVHTLLVQTWCITC